MKGGLAVDEKSQETCLLCGATGNIEKIYKLRDFELFAKPGQTVEIEYYLCQSCSQKKDSQYHAEALLQAKAIFLSQSYAVRPDWETVH